MKVNSLISTCLAVGAMIAMPSVVRATDPQKSDFASELKGQDSMLLAQAEVAGSKKHSKGPKLNVDSKGVILKGYDPVAYFKQGKAVKGDPAIASSYNGATYYFSSKSDKADFDKTPANFAPQYGGFCASSMSKKRLKDIDPNNFLIYKGKLYVCSTPHSVKEFTSKPDVNVQKADANWQLYELPSSPGFNRQFGS